MPRSAISPCCMNIILALNGTTYALLLNKSSMRDKLTCHFFFSFHGRTNEENRHRVGMKCTFSYPQHKNSNNAARKEENKLYFPTDWGSKTFFWVYLWKRKQRKDLFDKIETSAKMRQTNHAESFSSANNNLILRFFLESWCRIAFKLDLFSLIPDLLVKLRCGGFRKRSR